MKVFPRGRLLKTKKWVRLPRESREREEKQASDRAPRNARSKGRTRGIDPIKDIEKHIVSAEKICCGIR